MKRLCQPLTFRNDISIQNKFNLKSNWFLIYEGKPPSNWTFVHCEHQRSFHRKPACFMPRAASTCLRRFLIPHSHLLLPVDLHGKGEREGNACFPDSTTERAAIWVKQQLSSQRSVPRNGYIPTILCALPSRGSPEKPVRVPKDSRLFGFLEEQQDWRETETSLNAQQCDAKSCPRGKQIDGFHTACVCNPHWQSWCGPWRNFIWSAAFAPEVPKVQF